MDNTAFHRARRFLNYHPVAKWVAIASSVATAVLFFVLILILALYVDIVVNRGELPSLFQVPVEQREAFYAEFTLGADAEAANARKQQVHETLQGLNLDAELQRWFAGQPVKSLPYRERALLWYVGNIQYAARCRRRRRE